MTEQIPATPLQPAQRTATETQTPTAPPDGVVVFSAQDFKEIHPTLAGMSTKALQACFNQAVMLIGNDSASLIPYSRSLNITDRETALDLLTCHLATLESQPDLARGQVTSANEGGVSVSITPVTLNSGTAQYYGLTPCGLKYWQLFGRRLGKGGRLYGAGAEYHPWG